MSPGVVITPQVAADILEARGWYDSQQAGVGDKFYFNFRQRVQAALKSRFCPGRGDAGASARFGFRNIHILFTTKLSPRNCRSLQ